ncbi:MAG: hypothetical protein SGJ18_09685 [Pseudomonadota bacterium]|nr:hypothetical protein [Pseudomonadota bacterium]
MNLKILTGTLVLLTAVASFAEESQTTAPAPVAPVAIETTPSEGQTSAPVATVAPEAKKKAWKVALSSRALYPRVAADNGTGAVVNRNRFTFGYNLGPATVAIKPTWTNTYNVDTEVSKVSAGDLILEVSKPGITLNHDWSLTTTGRYYLPTSESSRLLASNGMAFLDLFFTRPLGTRLTGIIEGTYTNSFQAHRTAYQVKDAKLTKVIGKPSSKPADNLPADQVNTIDGNARYDMSHLVGLEYKINKKWAFVQLLSYANGYKYSDRGQSVPSNSSDVFSVTSYFTFQAAEKVGFEMGLNQDRNSESRAAQPRYTYMADAESEYYLLANISL